VRREEEEDVYITILECLKKKTKKGVKKRDNFCTFVYIYGKK